MDAVAVLVSLLYAAFVLVTWLLARAAEDFLIQREAEIEQERNSR